MLIKGSSIILFPFFLLLGIFLKVSLECMIELCVIWALGTDNMSFGITICTVNLTVLCTTALFTNHKSRGVTTGALWHYRVKKTDYCQHNWHDNVSKNYCHCIYPPIILQARRIRRSDLQ